MSDVETVLRDVLNQHLWVRHMTHRADCDCNWRTPEANTISAQREHAAHVAAKQAAALTALAHPSTDPSP